MKNARNAVAGLANSKHIDPELAHSTSLVLYQIIDPVYKISEQLRIIKEMGFNTVHSRIFAKLSFKLLSKYLIKRREKSKYVIDGIIITNDMVHDINIDGNPEFAWAFKDALDDMKAISTIIDIEWNQSKDGNIIPTLIIEPVDIGGVTIKRITGNNARYIKDNMLGIGADVEVIRSNDVIPKIERVINGVEPEFPEGEWDDNMVHIKVNGTSDDIEMKNIYYFFSTLNTVGLGEKNIERFYNAGYNSILKILEMSKSDIMDIDGFKEKSAENIITNIRKATSNIPLATLMKASNKLGRGMGEERAKDVLQNIPDIMTSYKKMSEDEFINKLKSINGWEDKTSRMFATNFKHFIDFYNSIKDYITIEMKSKKTGNKFKDMKIVMSGFRDKDLQEIIESNGGLIQSSVSKNTTILIIKDESVRDTSKAIKAKDLGVNVLTKDEFMQNFNP
jgi:NAD-dependent DNA ligase